MPRKAPGARARGLGAELRTKRENADLTVTAAAQRLGWTKSRLSRLETGRQNITSEDVASVLAVYGVTGAERERLLAIARNSDDPGLWEHGLPGLPGESTTLIGYEAEATSIISWEPSLIPGLLQTMDYARAFMLADGIAPDAAELRLTARLRRQQVVRKPDVEYLALIGEPALRDLIGGPQVMSQQLAALLDAADRPNVTVRVVPMESGPHPGLVGGFQMLTFPAQRPLVYVELARSGVFLDEQPLTGPYGVGVDRIRDVALDATESVRLITERMSELEER